MAGYAVSAINFAYDSSSLTTEEEIARMMHRRGSYSPQINERSVLHSPPAPQPPAPAPQPPPPSAAVINQYPVIDQGISSPDLFEMRQQLTNLRGRIDIVLILIFLVVIALLSEMHVDTILHDVQKTS